MFSIVEKIYLSIVKCSCSFLFVNCVLKLTDLNLANVLQFIIRFDIVAITWTLDCP